MPVRARFGLQAAVAIVAALWISNSARATIIYRETFGTATTGGQQASQDYDWAVHVGTTATNQSAQTGTTPAAVNRTANGSKPGTSDAIGNVNAGPVVGATPAAYGAGIPFTTPGAGNTIFWTPEYPARTGTSGIDPTAYSSLTFSFYEGNQNTDGNWRVAIHQGGQWYVSQQSFLTTASVTSAGNFGLGDDAGNGAANHGAELKSFAYSSTAATWFQLSFDGTFTLGGSPGVGGTGANGTVLTMGAQPASDLTGVIDAFGLFSDIPSTAGNRRFDTYTIDAVAVAEPATLAVSLIGIGLVFAARKRATN